MRSEAMTTEILLIIYGFYFSFEKQCLTKWENIIAYVLEENLNKEVHIWCCNVVLIQIN